MANFANIQASHIVPIVGAETCRLRTGYEGVIASRTRPPFAYTANDDGTIVAIDEANGVVKIRYKDGKEHCLTLGEEYTNNSANGFYVNQKIALNGFKVGDKFKKGDVITYNKEFFQVDPYSKQVNWKLGVPAQVAIVDCGGTLEDASVITDGLAEKMVFEPVHVKEIEITTDTHIHAFAAVGTKVVSTDPLMIFDESAMDFGDDASPELAEIFGELNKSAPKAEYTGEIVRVEALYKTTLDNMSESVRKVIKSVVGVKNARATFAEGCDNAVEYTKSKPLYATDKVGITDMTETTVIFRFYIKQVKSMEPGDKLFFDNCLKSVVSNRYDKITTEDGHNVDSLTSGRGILARLICSPFIQGIASQVLHRLEDNVLAEWDKQ